MNLFELFIKIGVDDQASGKISDLSSKLGNGLKTAAKIGTAAVATAAAGITALTTAAVNNYAEYEQLVGGVETLFKDSADTIQQYAENAYKTAGLSANEYMSTVTSFSASLIQSTGRGVQTNLDELEANLSESLKQAKRSYEDEYDALKQSWKERINLAKKSKDANVDLLMKQRDEELKNLKRLNADKLDALEAYNKEQLALAEEANNASVTTAESLEEAAKLADVAIVDMSDNANKMGTSMELIQNAYQGFAKQNYTMLDNLKLGYGGTKNEMERLISDANRVKEANGEMADLSIESFADVVEAIHIVQTEMGITGTTALEAGRTISGSVGAMKSAWQNLLTGLADGNADIGELVDNLVTTIVGDGTESNLGVLGNILPAVRTALNGAAKLVKELIPKIVREIPGIVKDNFPVLAEAAVATIQGFVSGISENQKTLSDTVVDTVAYLVESFIQLLPQIVQLGLDVLVSLANGIAQNLPTLIPTITAVTVQIVEILTSPENLSAIWGAALTLITELATGLIDSVPTLVDAAFTIVDNFIAFLLDPENLAKLIVAAVEIVAAIAVGLIQALPKINDAIAELVIHLVTGVSEYDEEFVGIGEKIVGGIWDGVKERWQKLVSWLTDAFSGIKWFLEILGIDTSAFEQPKTFKTGIVAYEDSAIGQTTHKSGKFGGGSEDLTINLVSELDGNVLAASTYRFNMAESNRRGVSLVEGAAV